MVHSRRICGAVVFAVWLALTLAATPQLAYAQAHPDLSNLPANDRAAIEAACAPTKADAGLLAYNRCLQIEIDQWAHGNLHPGAKAPVRPAAAAAPPAAPSSPAPAPTPALTLSSISAEDRRSIESACSSAKLLSNQATYNQCVQSQLAELSHAPHRPDLSGLGSEERNSVLSACSSAKLNSGPAAFNKCLQGQLDELTKGPRRPSLSNLSPEQRSSIETACSAAKLLSGPAAYNQCLQTQLKSFDFQTAPASEPPARQHQASPVQAPPPPAPTPAPEPSNALARGAAKLEARIERALRATQPPPPPVVANTQPKPTSSAAKSAPAKVVVDVPSDISEPSPTPPTLDSSSEIYWWFVVAALTFGGIWVGSRLIRQRMVKCPRCQSPTSTPGALCGPCTLAFKEELEQAEARHQEARRVYAQQRADVRGRREDGRRAKPAAVAVVEAVDPFAVLGIPRNATQDDIHAAYRRAMSNYHPDKVAHLGAELQEFAERKAQEINKAYQQLIREA